jgi:hypothetical protein
MIRVFCDICGKDITNYRMNRAEASEGRLSISVITAIDGVWNGGHVCVECIKKTCKLLDVKKKAEARDD